jgi:hypothetical protein
MKYLIRRPNQPPGKGQREPAITTDRQGRSYYFGDLATNPYHLGLNAFRGSRVAVFKGTRPIALCTGPPGIGKTHTVDTADELAILLLEKDFRPEHPHALVDELLKYQHVEKIIHFDDQYGLLRRGDTIEILQRVQDNLPVGSI